MDVVDALAKERRSSTSTSRFEAQRTHRRKGPPFRGKIATRTKVPQWSMEGSDEVETIVVGYNDSGPARAARRWALDYAATRDAELLLVYVVSSVWEWEAAAVQVNTDRVRSELSTRLDGAWSDPLRAAGIQFRTELLNGRPARAIMECAQRENASLIVVGMSTQGTLTELVFGSAAHRLERLAHRPVIAVPDGWEGPAR